jgi:hypothetical protein
MGPPPVTPRTNLVVGNVLTVCCACAGGLLGHLAFGLLIDRGLYALVVPGGFLGLAAGIPRSRSPIVPALCAILAIAAGLLTEYRYAPFIADGSFTYFVVHALELRPATWVLIGLGALIGFWFPFRRRIRGVAR